MFDNMKEKWAELPFHWKALFVIVAIMAALAIFTHPADAQERGAPQCQIVEGNPDVRVCEFTPETTPICHAQGEFASPTAMAEHYGGFVYSYGQLADTSWLLLIGIVDPATGELGATMAFVHPDVIGPNDGVCLAATGRPVKGTKS